MSNETKWSLYDSNVQSYRSNMISSQAFLLAVGAIVLEKSLILLAICCAIALIQLWYIWFRVIYCRTLISDFYKFEIAKKYNANGDSLETTTTYNVDNGELSPEQTPITEDKFVNDKKVQKKIYADYADKNGEKYKTNMRLTRKKLDVFIPVTFSILWLALILYNLGII